MKNILIVLVAVIVLLPIGGMAQSTNENVVKFSTNTTYIGFDNNWFSSKILVNITTPKFGHLVYVEEYFTVDSDSAADIGTTDIGTLENKTVNISEKEKLSVADSKDDHTYIIIGSILSIVAIIISIYVIVRNKKFYRK